MTGRYRLICSAVALLLLLPCASAQVYVPEFSQLGGTIDKKNLNMNILENIVASSAHAEYIRYTVTGRLLVICKVFSPNTLIVSRHWKMSGLTFSNGHFLFSRTVLQHTHLHIANPVVTQDTAVNVVRFGWLPTQEKCRYFH